MGGRGRRSRVEPTDEWEQLALLCRWPEQLAYEEIRPLTLFGASVARSAGIEPRVQPAAATRRVNPPRSSGLTLRGTPVPANCLVPSRRTSLGLP
jgi:hypothetical protein